MAKDLFSGQAELYAKFRPVYPQELIDFLIGQVKEKRVAWDCGTGNGQVARALAPHFEQVLATDISEKQLAAAAKRDNIEYLLCPAERTTFAKNSFDLITVGQAYHWFNFEAFAEEANRVGKPGAVVAVWGYGLITTNRPQIDSCIKDFYSNTVGAFWDSERKYVEDHYGTIPFHFTPLPSAKFSISADWMLSDLAGYLRSWSAVQHFIAANNYDPVQDFIKQVGAYWDDPELLHIQFPVFLKIGRINK